jgi:hypothetical protein
LGQSRAVTHEHISDTTAPRVPAPLPPILPLSLSLSLSLSLRWPGMAKHKSLEGRHGSCQEATRPSPCAAPPASTIQAPSSFSTPASSILEIFFLLPTAPHQLLSSVVPHPLSLPHVLPIAVNSLCSRAHIRRSDGPVSECRRCSSILYLMA